MAGLTAELTEPNSTECDDRFGSGTWLIPFRGCLLISMSICSTPDAVAAGRPCKELSGWPQRMRNGAERCLGPVTGPQAGFRIDRSQGTYVGPDQAG